MSRQRREYAPVFVRVHTNARNKARRGSYRGKWARYALVFDTETTIDTKQSLTLGFYRFCELQHDGNYACQEEGILYPDRCGREALRCLRKYAESARAETLENCPERLFLHSRSQFVKEVLWRAYEARAVIVGCNLGFDLTRLAEEYRISRQLNTGWSLVLSRYFDRHKRKWLPNTYRPRIRIDPKDSRDAFISFAGGDSERPFWRGRFLNLLTLAWALRNQRHSLKSACKSWRVKGKLNHKPTGKVSRKEVEYCRQDVRATVSLLNAMKAEYDRYPIELQPEKAFSPASIAKAYLDKMGLRHPAEKFSLPDKIHGIAMQGYYGGRSEIRIRHATVPIVYCDFTSEYPTVNSLLGLWRHFVARTLKVRNCTREAGNLLHSLTLSRLFRPETWQKLGFFALVKPEGHILPVRSIYSDTGETNIGLNPLKSPKPIWYAGPDLAASVLLSKRKPTIIRAIRLVPGGIQAGLRSVALGDRTIDPARDDFFRVVIENRKQLPPDHPMYYFLKILANAGGYGMYAELNREDFGKNSRKPIRVYSGELQTSPQRASTLEIPGPWYFPPVATLITAGGRLLLAMLEKTVTDAGGSYMMCDTDSMAIVSTKRGKLVPCAGGPRKFRGGDAVGALPWRMVAQIAAKFNSLNPYDQTIVKDILKIEDHNFDRRGRQQQLYGLAISAKRYLVFAGNGQIIKPSEHGLGPYFHPNKRRYIPRNSKNQKDSYPQWIVNGWRWILQSHQGRKQKKPEWFNIPAMRKIAITTPNILVKLRRTDAESAKPYNFVLSPILLFEGPTLIAPFSDDRSRWAGLRNGIDYISVEDGKRFRICKPVEDRLLVSTPGFVGTQKLKGRCQYLFSTQVRYFDDVFREYSQHPESKSLAPDDSPCGAGTRGVLRRRPIEALPIFRLIGKEVDRHAQEDVNVFSDAKPLEYREREGSSGGLDPSSIRKLKSQPIRELMRSTELGQHTIERALRGERIHAGTRLRLLKAARAVPLASLAQFR